MSSLLKGMGHWKGPDNHPLQHHRCSSTSCQRRTCWIGWRCRRGLGRTEAACQRHARWLSLRFARKRLRMRWIAVHAAAKWQRQVVAAATAAAGRHRTRTALLAAQHFTAVDMDSMRLRAPASNASSSAARERPRPRCAMRAIAAALKGADRQAVRAMKRGGGLGVFGCAHRDESGADLSGGGESFSGLPTSSQLESYVCRYYKVHSPAPCACLSLVPTAHAWHVPRRPGAAWAI